MRTLKPEEFAQIYGEESLFEFPKSLPEKPSFLQRTIQSATQGIGKMKTAFQESQAGRNPLETGAKLGAGVIETAFSPITAGLQPAIEPTLGKGIEYVSDKISDSPTVQKFAMGKGGKIAERGAELTGNLATIAGAATLQKIPSAVKSATGTLGSESANLAKQVSTIAREKAGSQPAKIMQRVARISKGNQAKFEQMAKESVGDYLTKRGIYGNIDDISTKLYERFTKSKSVADDALDKLKGEFDPTPVKTMLDDLYARELRVSSEGAPSPILSEVSGLIRKGRWNMSEINQIKRLYERNVKTDYLRQNLPESVAKANNLDSAVRNWQLNQAKTLGLKNLDKINRETRLAKQLMDELGKEYSGQAGNNAMTLTDWIMLSGGDPTAISGFLVKKTFSSKSVQSAIAKALNKGKPIMGDVEADLGTSQVLQLPAGAKGGMRSQIGSGAPIKVAPTGSNIEITGKQGITNSSRTKPQTPQLSEKVSQKPLTESTTISKELQPLATEARKYKSAEDFVSELKKKPYSEIGEQYRAALKSGDHYEFHLSREKNLIPGKSFAEQIRTISKDAESGQAGGSIYSSKNPDFWMGELGQKGATNPNQLYLVKVKNFEPSGKLLESGGESQSFNLPKDVVVVEKMPTLKNGVPDFGLAQELREKRILTDIWERANKK